MKKVFIKYNPYKIETDITIDGEKLKDNSKLHMGEKRLQEWIEDFPVLLEEEINHDAVEITFYGTIDDFLDVESIFESSELDYKLEHVEGKEVTDKESKIEKMFETIQSGPFEELNTTSMTEAFHNVKNGKFEIPVIATMSTGKSTLINALLGKKLMPSASGACTAIITRIEDEDGAIFSAKIYNEGHNLIETRDQLTLDDMIDLNNDEMVKEIHIKGDIPFVEAKDNSLVLIDTPGPNNARNEEHKKTQEEFLNKNSKALVLFVMKPEYEATDDNELLEQVSSSMLTGGKQSQDRFLFVINKMDLRGEEDGEIEETLKKIREYLLTNFNIKNPNIFPITSLKALNIRNVINGEKVSGLTIDRTKSDVAVLNKYEDVQLETYASLPKSLKNKVASGLSQERAEDNMNDALIHTGIPSLELAIQQYVEKYAKTAKIKNLYDTFNHMLEEVEEEEGIKEKLLDSLKEESEKIDEFNKNITDLRVKINSGKEATKFKEKMTDFVKRTYEAIKNDADTIMFENQSEIVKLLDEIKNVKLEKEDAENEKKRLIDFVHKIQPEFQNNLNRSIENNLISNANILLNQYKEKLASFAEELDVSDSKIEINPLKLMTGQISEVSLDSITREEDVVTEKYIRNKDKSFWKPWTWLQEAGYMQEIHNSHEYVDGQELIDNYLVPVEKYMYDDVKKSLKYSEEKATDILIEFESKFKDLDKILNAKIDLLEDYGKNKDRVESRTKDTKRKLKWLENIKNGMDSILDI